MAKNKAIKKDVEDYGNFSRLANVLSNTKEILDSALGDLDALINGEYTGSLIEGIPAGYEFEIRAVRTTLKTSVLATLENVIDDLVEGMHYEASTKKSNSKQSVEKVDTKIGKIGTVVNINPDDLTVAIGFWSAGMQTIDKDERLDIGVSLDVGEEWGTLLEASWEDRIPISELISQERLDEIKRKGADLLMKKAIGYNSRYRNDGHDDDMYTLYAGSTKKSKDIKKKSFNNMVKDIRSKNNKKRVM